MTFRTEDQVRNQAGITLGFIDAKGNNVETTDYLSGVGQVTSFIQLGTKLGTSDFMGISDKPDGWFLPFNQNGVAIVLETKSEKEDVLKKKWETELIKNIEILQKHYTKVAGILYNGKDCRVFMNQEEVISPAAKLQRLEYYTQLFVPDTIDKGRMAFIWECMPEETIDEKIINDYKTFVFNNLAKDKPIVPAVQVVARYCERDSKLKAVVIKAVLTNPQMSANFLSYVYDDVAVEGIINFFENDIIALASIYMSAIENNCHIDYDGKLFKRIFEQHPTVWNEYVDWIKSKDTMCGDGNEHKIIELIWGDDKWRECVEYAFKVLIDDDVIFHIKEPADMLFTNTTDETILERKKYWLIEKLRETSLELKKCKKLIEMVVNVLPDWKLEYILEFLKINKNPEDFKEIPLFPSSYSWSGSEIPLIMEKIDFLKSLKDNIKGINFIEHRKYIEEYRMNLERYKDNVELREYLENADYA